jgi:hypothetical protein
MATRRTFLATAAAAASAGALAACARGANAPQGSAASPAASATASPDLDHFMTLSALLTGYTTLDATAGATYLQNLRSDPQLSPGIDDLFMRSGLSSDGAPKSLAELTARGVFNNPAALALYSRILADWYSGTYDAASGTVTQTWTGALAWKACTFTKPPATCGGPTGYWAKPPA